MFQNPLVPLLTAVTPRKPMSWLFLLSQRKRLPLQNCSWHERVGLPSAKPHGRQTTKVCDKCFSRKDNPPVHMQCYTPAKTLKCHLCDYVPWTAAASRNTCRYISRAAIQMSALPRHQPQLHLWSHTDGFQPREDHAQSSRSI